jgi:hypothetical protein
MKTEVKLITPALAKKLLENNNMNRALKPQMIKEYARQMIVGLWKEDTGEAIKIAFDGTLLDGQQRLTALIDANVELKFLVISDLGKEIFTVLDSGIKRNAGDAFHCAGILNATNVAAGIKRYFILKTGRRNLNNVSPNNSASFINTTEIFTLYNKNPKFWDAAYDMASRWYKNGRLLRLSEYIGIYAYLYDIDQDDAFSFIDSLSNGENLDAADPIKQLRDTLVFTGINKKFTLTSYHRTALIFKAWNIYRKRGKVKRLYFNAERDNYPIAI